jgi:NAD-dependent deacetylase
MYKNVQPNVGHYSIAAFEQREQLLGLITQNVDGLHTLAGLSPERVVELHGTDRKVSCLSCGKEFAPEPIYARLSEGIMPAPCDACGGLLKPATVSFGQSMPLKAMRRAQEWSEAAGVFIVVGSSLVVQPAASFPAIAKQSGALLAIVNRDETPLDSAADYNFRSGIGEFFTALNPLLSDG